MLETDNITEENMDIFWVELQTSQESSVLWTDKIAAENMNISMGETCLK